MLIRGDHQRAVEALLCNNVSALMYCVYQHHSITLTCHLPCLRTRWIEVQHLARARRWERLKWCLYMQCNEWVRTAVLQLLAQASPRLYITILGRHKKGWSAARAPHSGFIMITRGDVQRVVDAFILEET